jgi:DNA-binding MarR family transcriptional regulator
LTKSDSAYTHIGVGRSSDLAECRGCLCLASRSAARRITAVYDRRLRPYGVRATQFTILTMLMLRGATPVGALAKTLGMDRTTLTRNTALLAQKGWVTDAPDSEDARSHILSVTPVGQALVRRALPAWREGQESVANAFGPTGVAALRKLAGTRMP